MMETVTRHIIVISFRVGDFIDFIAAVALLLTETFTILLWDHRFPAFSPLLIQRQYRFLSEFSEPRQKWIYC